MRKLGLYSILLFLLVLLIASVVTGCGAADDTGTLSGYVSPVQQLPETSGADESIKQPGTPEIVWNEAEKFVGTEVKVCGPVMDTKWASGSNGKPTFLNLGRSYPDPERFTVVIWDEYRNNFSEPPEEMYIGKTICVSGKVTEYKNSPQIEVRYPSQIEIK